MKLQEINEQLDAIKAQYDEAVASIRDSGLKEIFKDFFDANPEIKGFAWSQWIPGFNDGDPCTFTIGEIVFTKSQTCVDSWPDGSSEDDIYDAEEAGQPTWLNNTKTRWVANPDYDPTKPYHRKDNCSTLLDPVTNLSLSEPNPNFNEDFAQIEKFINDNENLIETLFGSDSQILVTPEKITVEDYYCGY